MEWHFLWEVLKHCLWQGHLPYTPVHTQVQHSFHHWFNSLQCWLSIFLTGFPTALQDVWYITDHPYIFDASTIETQQDQKQLNYLLSLASVFLPVIHVLIVNGNSHSLDTPSRKFSGLLLIPSLSSLLTLIGQQVIFKIPLACLLNNLGSWLLLSPFFSDLDYSSIFPIGSLQHCSSCVQHFLPYHSQLIIPASLKMLTTLHCKHLKMAVYVFICKPSLTLSFYIYFFPDLNLGQWFSHFDRQQFVKVEDC